MTLQNLDRLVAGILILFGVWLIISGVQMGVMRGYVPGAGLFPLLIGAGIAALSVINLIRAVAGIEKLAAGMSRKSLFQAIAIIVILLGVVISVPLLGLTLATFTAMILVGVVIQIKMNLRASLLLLSISIVTAVSCRFLFQGLLNVPIPSGFLGF